jgi:formylglycine-generating enzyme required for sulfatase activity
MRMRRESISSLIAIAAFLGQGCYRHARPDAPASPSSSVAGEMVSVPPGTFTMGDQNGEPDEYPERQITIRGFKIDRMEVSNRAFRACVEARGCDRNRYVDDENLGRDELPAVGVSWLEAEKFCKWVGKRLPTEAEWEYAARGLDFRKWPWKGAFLVHRANTVEEGDKYDLTAPVDSFPDGASPFGALNMAGNAAEWVSDYYDPTWHRKPEATTSDPTGPPSGRERVVRGGSYRDPQHSVRVSSRRAQLPTEVDSTIGFRCASGG